MQDITLSTTNPTAKLLVAILNDNRIIYDELVATQEEAIAAGDPPMALPLVWLAMLNLAGFVVDPATAKIVDGPQDQHWRGIAYRYSDRYPQPAEGLRLAEGA